MFGYSCNVHACDSKNERLALFFFSRPNSSSFNETGIKDQLSLLSRKIIDGQNIRSVLQIGVFQCYIGCCLIRFFLGASPRPRVLFAPITMGARLASIAQKNFYSICLVQGFQLELYKKCT